MVGRSPDLLPVRSPLRRSPDAVLSPSIAVVIVNFCQWKNTIRLVRQLRKSHASKSGSARIVVVDNGSQTKSHVKKLDFLNDVDVDRVGENLGFAKAVNRGCRGVDADWILLLNPDVTVDDGFLDDAIAAALRILADHPQMGVLGLHLKNPDGSPQPSCGRLPSLLTTLTGVVSPRWRRKCQLWPGDDPKRVPWATGGCLLIRRDCFELLGGMDEQFFLYYEDVDFCRRAMLAGYEVWYSPQAGVTHHWPLHARPVPAPLRLITRNALLTYSRRHWSRWQSWLLGRVISLEARLRAYWARRAGNHTAADFYRTTRKMVGDLESGRTAEVRDAIALAAEHLVAVAAAQDGRTS
jgi:N-acetylglucosaminyl-diphospho-decaprenol L-rhamnosyltransferase